VTSADRRILPFAKRDGEGRLIRVDGLAITTHLDRFDALRQRDDAKPPT
jgi:hypothetical protein